MDNIHTKIKRKPGCQLYSFPLFSMTQRTEDNANANHVKANKSHHYESKIEIFPFRHHQRANQKKNKRREKERKHCNHSR